MGYARYKRRSLHWLLGAYVVCSTTGAIGGGFAFIAAGESAVVPAFLVPAMAGVLLISRAFYEGRWAERAASHAGTPSDDQ